MQRKLTEVAINALAIWCLTFPVQALGSTGRAEETPAGESLCYAYLRNGDLYVTCGGAKNRITTTGDLTGYAVARDGSSVAFLYNRTSKADQKAHRYVDELVVI